MNITPSSKRTGFTLVEILVALSILAILSALLLGVFSHVQESGRRTACQSNLKQIGLAMKQYVADADGYYPLGYYEVNKGLPNAGLMRWDDTLSTYLKNKVVFRCPSNQLSHAASLRDYDYNRLRLNVYKLPLSDNDTKGAHEATLGSLINIEVVIEDMFSDEDGNYFNSGPPTTSSCGRSYWGSTVHAGGANYLFADGHVKWLTQQQMGEIDCLNPPLPTFKG